MLHKVFGSLLFLLTFMFVMSGSAFAQDELSVTQTLPRTYTIQVQVERNRYEPIEFTEFPVYQVAMPRDLSYIELWSRDGDGSRVSLEDFPVVFGAKVPVVEADIDLVCDDHTYHLNTYTKSGHCGSNVNGVMACEDDAGNSASASCEDGCIESSGSGSCTAD